MVLYKVKSHTHISDIGRVISLPNRQGNAFADPWAAKGVELDCVPETTATLLKDIDSTAWMVQSRIAAAIQMLSGQI